MPDNDLNEAPSTGAGLPELAWRSKWLIILGALAGLGVGAARYSQQPPVYQSGVQVLIDRKSPDVSLTGGSADLRGMYYDDYLSTHLTLIRSPEVCRRAVARLDLDAAPSLKGHADPVGAIIGGLTVSRDNKESAGSTSSIINMSFRGSEAMDCPRVLHAVYEGYRDFLDDKSSSISSEAVRLITDAKKTLREDLARKQKEFDEFRQKHPVFWAAGKGGVTPRQDRINTIEGQLTTLIVRQSEIQDRLAWVAASLKVGRPRGEVAAALGQSDGRDGRAGAPAGRGFEDQLFSLKLEEASALQDYAKDHYKVRAIRQRAELIASAMKAASPSEAEPVAKPADDLSRAVAALEFELEENQPRRKSLEKLLEQEKNELKEMVVVEAQYDSYRRDIDATREFFDATVKRLTELDLMRNSSGYGARIISPAGVGAKVAPTLGTALLVGALLGALVGFGGGYLVHVTDKSFHSPDEVRARLGLPVVGHMPFVGSDDTKGHPIDASLISVHNPRSPEAEVFRGVRTALYFNTHGRDHQIIQVTSPNAGDGKSTLTANLAVSIAQSGRRTLLIDADFRKPRVHRLFGQTAERGLADALMNGTPPADAVVPSGVANLSLLPCGRRPENPAELLTSPRFQEALASLRDQFDMILVDTPPLLAVSDPAVVAPRVDGLLLVIRVGRNSRPSAERARSTLNSLGVNILGVVVNGGDQEAGGYGFAYASQGYRYSDSYKDEGQASYYAPDGGEAKPAPRPAGESGG